MEELGLSRRAARTAHPAGSALSPRDAMNRLIPLLTALLIALRPGNVAAWDPSTCVERVASQHLVVIDCQPGWATGHDRILVYDRSGVPDDSPGTATLNQQNAVWVFQTGPGTTRLIIDFHQDNRAAVADLFDDGDGDGVVSYLDSPNGPIPAENDGRWTVRVIAPDGWWKRGATVNYNLDLLVDGPVRGSTGSGFLYDYQRLLRTDGRLDFAIHVRDPDGTGRPAYEWRQDYPPLPEDPLVSGYYRTQIIVNPNGDEPAATASLLWPYLSTIVGEPVKGYNQGLAPIQVDWTRAKIVQIAEFVASRGHPGNFFIYSIRRVREGETNTTDFENPFAFYDLANAHDGYPDVTIRFEAWPGVDQVDGLDNQPVNIVEYTWDQYHRHQWNYEISLVGRQPVTTIIQLPEFAIRAIPPALLPGYVTGTTWDAATFVEVERQPYWTSEHIYEWTVELGKKILPFRYVTGVDNHPPVEAFENIAEGFRGEYSFHLAAQPFLYFSPIDGRLHLLGADAGTWKVSASQELHYRNLGGRYINDWQLWTNGRLQSELYYADGQLILSSERGIAIRSIGAPPSLFTTLPPRNHDEWVRLGDRLQQHRHDTTGDDPQAMFKQFAGSLQELPGSTMSKFQMTSEGFRFVLRLAATVPSGPPWASGLQPGAYLVSYRQNRGFSVETLKPATLLLSPVLIRGQPIALQPVVLQTIVENRGNEDCPDVVIKFSASDDGRPFEPIGSVKVPAPANSSGQAMATWIPPAGGRWLIQAEISEGDVAASPAAVDVAAPPAANPRRLLVVSNPDARITTIIAVVLGTVLLVAAALATLLWRDAPEPGSASRSGASSTWDDDRA